MPVTKKVKAKKNYRALAHSQELSTLAVAIHYDLEHSQSVTLSEVDEVIRHATDLRASLIGTLQSPTATFDPFLTEEPKQPDVAKLPTVSVPAVEKPKEEPKKSGFLGR